jgi:hypothetical protein
LPSSPRTEPNKLFGLSGSLVSYTTKAREQVLAKRLGKEKLKKATAKPSLKRGVRVELTLISAVRGKEKDLEKNSKS